MKEGRNLVTEAVEDAKSLRTAATEAAKNELIEQMTPKIKELVEKTLRGKMKKEDTDRLRRGVEDNWPGESHTGFEENKEGDSKMSDKKEQGQDELDMESLMGMFPMVSETDDLEMEQTVEGGIPALGEAKDEEEVAEAKKKDDEEEKMDEEIEISEESIRQVYEAAMKAQSLAEVQMTKGFGEMSKGGELDEVDPAAGIADVKKGEHDWSKETPPAKQDFTVKEAIKRGLAENKMLKNKLGEALNIIEGLRSALTEVNLFNAKVMHVNRILNKNGNLTKEQKVVVLESIDQARTVAEVKMVFETINKSFAASTVVESRSRKPTTSASRARTSGAPDQKVLRESVDRQENNVAYSRMQQLAGLKNDVK